MLLNFPITQGETGQKGSVGDKGLKVGQLSINQI